MNKESIGTRIAELAVFSFIIAGINLVFPRNPGFLEGFFNPYAMLALFVCVLYGKYAGFLSLFLSILMVVFPLPLANAAVRRGGMPDMSGYWRSLWSLAPVPLCAALVEIYLFGLVRDSLARKEKTGRARVSAIAREKGLLKRQVRALQSANLELEERIDRQEDSITSMYGHVKVLQSLNLEKAVQAILEMVRRFVGASRCSIWEHSPDRGSLVLVASHGWEESATTVIPDESSIEGWVVRNNMMFSVKMLLENEALVKLDKGRNIMTLPISTGRRIWGVLNIEEMPFEKYNPYAERLLLLLMALAGPALERAIEFESVIKQEDINPTTGLPSFPRFYSQLEKELGRLAIEKGTLAVVIFELLNFTALESQWGREAVLRLLAEVTKGVQSFGGNQARFFHYKNEDQIVLLHPNLDGDGASLFCLNVLEKVNSQNWEVNENRVRLELILGFAARSGTEKSPEEILEAAERLLEMQKV